MKQMDKLTSLTLAAFLLEPLTSLHAAGAAQPAKPNILFAVADDWSYGHAGAYGCSWVKTPSLDRVAREGILFTHAYTPNGKCAPSRAALLTGRNPWQLKAAANHWCYFPAEFKTFPETGYLDTDGSPTKTAVLKSRLLPGQKHYWFDDYPYSNPADRGLYERFIRGERKRGSWASDSDVEKTPLE